MVQISDRNLISYGEKLYIYEHLTCVEIAKEVGKHRRTVEAWKKKYGWVAKRIQYMDSQRALPQKLYEHYNIVMDSICDDIKEKREVSASKYRLASLLFEQIPKAKEVEQAAAGEIKKNDVPVEKIAEQIAEGVMRALSPKTENGKNDEK